jgi:hypothetical protein
MSPWPARSRLIVRKERARPGAQLRFTDADVHRVTGFLTNSGGDDLAALELRHRRHARVVGPHPRQGHRAAQPALPRRRGQLGVARDRDAGRPRTPLTRNPETATRHVAAASNPPAHQEHPQNPAKRTATHTLADDTQGVSRTHDRWPNRVAVPSV